MALIAGLNRDLVWNVEVTLHGLVLSGFEIQEKSMRDPIELVDIALRCVNNKILDFHIELFLVWYESTNATLTLHP